MAERKRRFVPKALYISEEEFEGAVLAQVIGHLAGPDVEPTNDNIQNFIRTAKKTIVEGSSTVTTQWYLIQHGAAIDVIKGKKHVG